MECFFTNQQLLGEQGVQKKIDRVGVFSFSRGEIGVRGITEDTEKWGEEYIEHTERDSAEISVWGLRIGAILPR